MVETGIPRLDDLLGGGVPMGKSLLYYVHPGVEGNVFGMQTLCHNLDNGRKGVFVTSTNDPDHLRAYFGDFSWNTEKYRDNFTVVDAYSRLIGAESKEKYVVEDPSNIESYDETFQRVIEENSRSVVVVGSLSTIMDLCGEAETLEYIEIWNKYIMLNDCVGIYNFTAWPYSEETLKKLKEELFNSVVLVGGIAERFIYGQYYGVLKADWTKVVEKCVLFKVIKPGGVKAYIPKLLVTGPFDAGKSTFVQALSTRAVSVDRLGTTVALDHGHVDHKGFSVDIFGTPGQERFDPILKLLGGEAMGLFLVVDSSLPKHFPRAKSMIELTRGSGLPLVIVANKQDVKGALKPEEIRKRMNIGEGIKIIPAVATEKKGVLEAFETLVNMVVEAD